MGDRVSLIDGQEITINDELEMWDVAKISDPSLDGGLTYAILHDPKGDSAEDHANKEILRRFGVPITESKRYIIVSRVFRGTQPDEMWVHVGGAYSDRYSALREVLEWVIGDNESGKHNLLIYGDNIIRPALPRVIGAEVPETAEAEPAKDAHWLEWKVLGDKTVQEWAATPEFQNLSASIQELGSLQQNLNAAIENAKFAEFRNQSIKVRAELQPYFEWLWQEWPEQFPDPEAYPAWWNNIDYCLYTKPKVDVLSPEAPLQTGAIQAVIQNVQKGRRAEMYAKGYGRFVAGPEDGYDTSIHLELDPSKREPTNDPNLRGKIYATQQGGGGYWHVSLDEEGIGRGASCVRKAIVRRYALAPGAKER